MVMGKCMTEGCVLAQHATDDYRGLCCKACKPGKDKHDHYCQQRGPCKGDGCKFFKHSVKYQHGFCCDKCEEKGNKHGPMCEKFLNNVVGDAAPPPPPPAPLATGPCKNAECTFHVHTTADYKGACCKGCPKKHDHSCEQRARCKNVEKCGFFRHSTKYQHGACCDVCDSGSGKRHGPLCEKVSVKK